MYSIYTDTVARLPAPASDSSLETACPRAVAERRLRQCEEAWQPPLSTTLNDKRFGAPLPRRSVSMVNFLTKFEADDFHVNKYLGQGSFSIAHRVFLKEEILLKKGYKKDSDNAFAMKRLKPSVIADPNLLQVAAADLAVEIDILAKVKHENIVALHGIKAGNKIESLINGSFFLILELLSETLSCRMKRWQNEKRSIFDKSSSRIAICRKLRDIALGIAKGMAYLHARRVVFRDLKPANVGFDELDRIKIFDFGLARECDPNSESEENRLMTMCVGTPRYMAPEVFITETYDHSADVYSFSILLWELVTKRQSPTVVPQKVVEENKRPNLKYLDSEGLRELLASGWSRHPENRPTFDYMLDALEDIAVRYDQSPSEKRRWSLWGSQSKAEKINDSCMLDRTRVSLGDVDESCHALSYSSHL